MILPWNLKKELQKKEDKIDKLQNKIENLEEESEKWEKRFQAEEERRSKLSTEKQKAEEERNRLSNKLSSLKTGNKESETDNSVEKFDRIDYIDCKNILEKIGCLGSDGDDLVTVRCVESLEKINDIKKLKNSMPKRHYQELPEDSPFVAFSDPLLGLYVIKLHPFYSEDIIIDSSFEIDSLIDFMEKEKYWCLVSSGNSTIYREQDGKYTEIEKIKQRVDREHSKGGFSQGRFERKREEQVRNHVDEVKKKLEDYDEVYLIGDKKICDKLEGTYLGGFDPNQKKPSQFYNLRFQAFF